MDQGQDESLLVNIKPRVFKGSLNAAIYLPPGELDLSSDTTWRR